MNLRYPKAGPVPMNRKCPELKVRPQEEDSPRRAYDLASVAVHRNVRLFDQARRAGTSERLLFFNVSMFFRECNKQGLMLCRLSS